MKFSVLPSLSPDSKKVCAISLSLQAKGAIQGLEAPPKHSLQPKDEAGRIKRSRPMTVVTSGQAPSQDWSGQGESGLEQGAWPLPHGFG